VLFTRSIKCFGLRLGRAARPYSQHRDAVFLLKFRRNLPKKNVTRKWRMTQLVTMVNLQNVPALFSWLLYSL